MWAAKTPVARVVWLGWLAAPLQLDDSWRYSCRLPRTDGILLSTAKGAEEQSGHEGSVLKREQSPGYFFIATFVVRACLYVTSGLHICTDYHRERKKPLRRSFIMKKIEIPPSVLLVKHKYV